jgi:hypothetical protein
LPGYKKKQDHPAMLQDTTSQHDAERGGFLAAAQRNTALARASRSRVPSAAPLPFSIVTDYNVAILLGVLLTGVCDHAISPSRIPGNENRAALDQKLVNCGGENFTPVNRSECLGENPVDPTQALFWGRLSIEVLISDIIVTDIADASSYNQQKRECCDPAL